VFQGVFDTVIVVSSLSVVFIAQVSDKSYSDSQPTEDLYTCHPVNQSFAFTTFEHLPWNIVPYERQQKKHFPCIILKG
jgi:hypothetical protein